MLTYLTKGDGRLKLRLRAFNHLDVVVNVPLFPKEIAGWRSVVMADGGLTKAPLGQPFYCSFVVLLCPKKILTPKSHFVDGFTSPEIEVIKKSPVSQNGIHRNDTSAGKN